VSQVHHSLKNFILKIQGGKQPIHLTDLFCIIMGYCNLSIFKMAAVHYLGILKLKFFTANHFRDTFCITTLNFVEIGGTVAEVSHFF